MKRKFSEAYWVAISIFCFVIFSGWYSGLNMLERGIEQANCLFSAVALSILGGLGTFVVRQIMNESDE